MSDTAYETFQHYGTQAERLAFTPVPAAGIQPIYIWKETDEGGNTWVYDTAWHPLGDVLYLDVTLDNAQIKALPTTNTTGFIELVAAPGAGFMAVPLWQANFGNFSAGAYTNIHTDGYIGVETNDRDGYGLQYIDNSAAASSLSAFLGVAADTYAFCAPFAIAFGSPDAQVAAQVQLQSDAIGNIVLGCSNTGGDFTGGHVDNTWRIRLAYTVIEL